MSAEFLQNTELTIPEIIRHNPVRLVSIFGIDGEGGMSILIEGTTGFSSFGKFVELISNKVPGDPKEWATHLLNGLYVREARHTPDDDTVSCDVYLLQVQGSDGIWKRPEVWRESPSAK